MIYRLSIYYYRYSLLWLSWEKCRSTIPLANFGTTPTQSWSGTPPNKASRTITGIMHWTLGTATLRRAAPTAGIFPLTVRAPRSVRGAGRKPLGIYNGTGLFCCTI